jgi:hypothetical protein
VVPAPLDPGNFGKSRREQAGYRGLIRGRHDDDVVGLVDETDDIKKWSGELGSAALSSAADRARSDRRRTRTVC